MSLHMKYSKALDLVWASLAAFASAAALALLHWSAGSRHGRRDEGREGGGEGGEGESAHGRGRA
jgi:hypothetical protein